MITGPSAWGLSSISQERLRLTNTFRSSFLLPRGLLCGNCPCGLVRFVIQSQTVAGDLASDLTYSETNNRNESRTSVTAPRRFGVWRIQARDPNTRLRCTIQPRRVRCASPGMRETVSSSNCEVVNPTATFLRAEHSRVWSSRSRFPGRRLIVPEPSGTCSARWVVLIRSSMVGSLQEPDAFPNPPCPLHSFQAPANRTGCQMWSGFSQVAGG